MTNCRMTLTGSIKLYFISARRPSPPAHFLDASAASAGRSTFQKLTMAL